LQRRILPASEREHLVMWRDGHLFFEGAPLAAAVKEVNRYNRRQLVVGDAATADLRIGGRFWANDVDSFVAAIQKTFGVRAQREGDDWVIREP
jgi:transmembrane sensor